MSLYCTHKIYLSLSGTEINERTFDILLKFSGYLNASYETQCNVLGSSVVTCSFVEACLYRIDEDYVVG